MAAMEKREKGLLQWQLSNALTPFSEAHLLKGLPSVSSAKGWRPRIRDLLNTPQTYGGTPVPK